MTMSSAHHVKAERLLNALARVCGALAAVTGLIAILGWITGHLLLASFGSPVPMAPSTALLFILFGSAVFLHIRDPLSHGMYRIVMSIGLTGVFAAVLLFFLSYLGIHLSVEHLGIPISGTAGGVPIGHISPLTAFCFVLVGMSFLAALLSTPDSPARAIAGFWLACLIIFISFVMIIAYLFGAPLLYGGSFIPPALSTSLAFNVMGISVLLFAALRMRAKRITVEAIDRRALNILIIVFVLLAVGIISAGYSYYHNYEKQYRVEVEQQLSSVAKMKVGELVDWRKERLADATVFYKNDNFYARAQRYLRTPDNAEAQTKLRTWLSQFHVANDEYDRISLLDTRGAERMSVPAATEPVAPYLLQSVSGVLRSGKVTFLDFHRNSPNQSIHLWILVPILDSHEGARAIGILVMRIDPQKYLYPLISQWPTSSRTAETLLVRREGNEALFLNELRFRKNTALNLRRPLTDIKMPAVKAAMGQEGIVEGIDYRGIPVIADVRSVPDSPWFLVARMDVSEVYMALREKLWEIVIIIGALLVGAGAGGSFIWRRQRERYYTERLEAAEALRESEEQFRAMFEVASIGIAQADIRTGKWLRVNEKMCEITGYTAAEMLQMRIPEITHPEDRQRDWEAFQSVVRGEAPNYRLEKRYIRKDGSPVWVNINMTVIKDSAGQPMRTIAAVEDISERKRVEKEREITVEFLHIVNSSSGTADLIHKAATFFQQQSGCEAVGIRLKEGDDYPYYEARGFPKEFVRMENRLCAHDKTGEVIRDSCGNPVLECMCGNIICGRFDPSKPFFSAGGSFWTNSTTELLATTTEADRQARTRDRCHGEGYESVSLIPLQVGDKRSGLIQLNSRRKGMFTPEIIALWERLAGYLAVALAKFRAEDALQYHEALLRETGRIAKVGGWEIDATNLKGTWTDEVARIHELDPEMETNVELSLSFYRGEQRTKIEKALQEAIETAKPYDLELEMITAKGNHKWVRTIGHPVKEDGKVVKIHGSFQDITEIKQAEEEIRKLNQELEQRVRERTAQLEASNKELEAFSYSVSHDLRAPLRAIDSFAEILLTEYGSKMDEEAQRICSIITRNSKRMGQLIDELLSLSRLGRTEMHFSSIDMRSLVDSIYHELTTPESRQRIDFRPGDLPDAAGDPTLIRQVWTNLISNALKFTARRQRPVISITATEEENHTVYCIIDNGAGFNMKYADKLFGVFQRLHSQKDFEGTGVGLAIVQRIVLRHGGEVWAKGEPEKGAAFFFSLPKKKGGYNNEPV